MSMLQTNALIEPFVVLDVYASGLAEVECIGGGNYRFTFFAMQNGERIVVARIVGPLDAIPPALIMAAKAIGCSMVATCPVVKKALH